MGMIDFIREFAGAPASIGAIAPSSVSLAKEMVRDLQLGNSEAVLEYGPGTGSFTPFILSEIPQGCKFVAIELNPRFAEAFRSRFRHVTLHESSVTDARQICNQYGIATADCIVSGLPWAAFSTGMQQNILDEMMRVLKPGGQFVTFAYVHGMILPPARRFAEMLLRYFSNIERSRIVWTNLPPAFVYRCRR